jgi:hypothetical protein
MQEPKRFGSGTAAVMATAGAAPLYNDILVISPNHEGPEGSLSWRRSDLPVSVLNLLANVPGPGVVPAVRRQ